MKKNPHRGVKEIMKLKAIDLWEVERPLRGPTDRLPVEE